MPAHAVKIFSFFSENFYIMLHNFEPKTLDKMTKKWPAPGAPTLPDPKNLKFDLHNFSCARRITACKRPPAVRQLG